MEKSETGHTDEILGTLESILSDKQTCVLTAYEYFKRYDTDNLKSVDLSQVVDIVNALFVELGLSEATEDHVRPVFERYDADDSGSLEFEEFVLFFWRLVQRVRDKFYKRQHYEVSRQVFIGRTPLKTVNDLYKLYNVLEKIGSGSFGEVCIVEEIYSGATRVCKQISKEKALVPLSQIEYEVRAMKELDHPNIVRIYDVYEDPETVFLIMEYCGGGELYKKLTGAQSRGRVFGEARARKIMRQIFSALACMHEKRILHKDLKPENILFVGSPAVDQISIIDFGLSEIFQPNQDVSHNAAGTVIYMAPEVFLRKLNFKSDVWSAGCIMYLMLSGYLAFSGLTVSEVKRKVLKQQPDYEHRCAHVSRLAYDLMKQCLIKKPSSRISAREALLHPWFQNGDTQLSKIPTKIVENFKSFSLCSPLQVVIFNLVAHLIAYDDKEVLLIARLFQDIDTDGDGAISEDELRSAMTDISGDEFRRILCALDIDNDGFIGYTEFIAGSITWLETHIERVRSAYLKICDGEWKLSVDKLAAHIIGEENLNSSIHIELQSEISCIDVDNKGYITWPEFLAYMRS